jgi:DNA polymerase-3 subunit epsilon
MLAYDCETTGIQVETDRIVTASAVELSPTDTSQWQVVRDTWLIAVDVDIPEAATAIHGVTTAHAREHGQPAAGVIDRAAGELALALTHGVPVVGMNLSFDLTLLDRECRRNRVPTLADRMDGRPVAPVLDVRILDKHVDTFRKGSRKLDALCETYGVPHDGAHDACEDALAAARVLFRIGQIGAGKRRGRIPEVEQACRRLAALTLDQLHDLQVESAAEQARSFAAYRERSGQPVPDDVEGVWPVRPLPAVEGAASC